MNRKINPEWVTAGYDYHRAAMVEAIEAEEHHGWKWWKNQEPDLAQLHMELVDICHFGLSTRIVINKGNLTETRHSILRDIKDPVLIAFDGLNQTIGSNTILENLDLLAGMCAAKRFSFKLFMHLVVQTGFSVEELYAQYVGKNVLNFFRQDNGYKDGTYVKEWAKREDNEHLVEILEELDSSSESYAEDVYAALKERYEIVTKE